MRRIRVLYVLALLGCTPVPVVDGGVTTDVGLDARRVDAASIDTGQDAVAIDAATIDAGFDASMTDAGLDAPADAGIDAASDAGPCVATIDDLAARLAVASCGLATRCDLMRQLSPLLTDCVAERTYDLAHGAYFGRYSDAIARGTLTLDGCALDACVAAVTAEPCYGRESLIPTLVDPACDRMFVGHIADGAHCTLDGECGLTSRCPLRAPGSCPGPLCEHVPQLGESCASENCDAGLWCDASRTCRTQLPAGAACNPMLYEHACPGATYCLPDGSADPTSGTCAPWQPVHAHDACGLIGTVLVYCDVGLVCDDTSHTCRPARTDGTCARDAISTIVTRDCALGTQCMIASGDEGTCVAPCGASGCPGLAHDGASCTNEYECLSEYCPSGHCASAPLCPTP